MLFDTATLQLCQFSLSFAMNATTLNFFGVGPKCVEVKDRISKRVNVSYILPSGAAGYNWANQLLNALQGKPKTYF